MENRTQPSTDRFDSFRGGMSHRRTQNPPRDLPGLVARVGVVVGTAILLTFCRGLMLAVAEQPTPIDTILNYFVLLVAPVCALYSLSQNIDLRFVKLICPIALILVWVSLCLFFFTPEKYWPGHSPIVSIFLAILIASQISRAELRLLRYSILFLAAVFSMVLIVWDRGLLYMALSSSAKERLGVEISPANVLIMPRVYYTLVFTCFASILIEKRLWLRLLAIVLMIIPALMGFSSGSRGPLTALIVAILVFSLGLLVTSGRLATVTFTLVFALLGYGTVVALFPTIVRRVGEDDTERISFYDQRFESISQNLSLIGNGKGDMYAHNIFLEFLQDYGVVGLALFLLFLGISLSLIWKVYRRTRDPEVPWAIGIILIQLVAQQFSLDIFIGSLWAALLLPIGLGWWQERMTREAKLRKPSLRCGLHLANFHGVLPGRRQETDVRSAQSIISTNCD